MKEISKALFVNTFLFLSSFIFLISFSSLKTKDIDLLMFKSS